MGTEISLKECRDLHKTELYALLLRNGILTFHANNDVHRLT